jgi:Sec-independent protein secretion pathway component TatC
MPPFLKKYPFFLQKREKNPVFIVQWNRNFVDRNLTKKEIRAFLPPGQPAAVLLSCG